MIRTVCFLFFFFCKQLRIFSKYSIVAVYFDIENVCLTKLSSGQETAVITSAVVGCDEIYVQLVSSANRFAEFQQNLNQNVVIRCVTKLPSKLNIQSIFYQNSYDEKKKHAFQVSVKLF